MWQQLGSWWHRHCLGSRDSTWAYCPETSFSGLLEARLFLLVPHLLWPFDSMMNCIMWQDDVSFTKFWTTKVSHMETPLYIHMLTMQVWNTEKQVRQLKEMRQQPVMLKLMSNHTHCCIWWNVSLWMDLSIASSRSMVLTEIHLACQPAAQMVSLPFHIQDLHANC